MSGTNPTGNGAETAASRIATLAQTAGAAVAVPALKSYVQRQVIDLVNSEDPDQLRECIEEDYPLVKEGLGEGTRNALGSVGPQFEDQIKSTVNPEGILTWLENPEEYIDAGDDEYEQIRRCAEIIHETEGGRTWLTSQVIQLWKVAGIT